MTMDCELGGDVVEQINDEEKGDVVVVLDDDDDDDDDSLSIQPRLNCILDRKIRLGR